jgi:hypothetical protein
MSIQIIIGKKRIKQYYRIPHDVERKNAVDDLRFMSDGVKRNVRAKVIDEQKRFPEVYRALPFHHVLLNCPCQWLWRRANRMLSDERWATLAGNELMLCNTTGLPYRYNCIDNAGKPIPKDVKYPAFDQARLFGGCIKEGAEISGLVYIKSMLISEPIKSVDEMLSDISYWHYATSVGVDGTIRYITRKGIDGKYHKVVIPHLTAKPIYLPADEVEALPRGITPKDFPDMCTLFHWKN